jgi:7-cyano-7-deazaguanine reductase
MPASKFKNLGVIKKGFPNKPDKNILETIDNKHPSNLYLVPLLCTEFTSLCPVTGQPDFGKFEIVYVPAKKMVESKSLKLYLFSFRNRGEFHEDVTNRIFNDLWELLRPKFMRVIGDFNVRGGITIKPLVQKFCDDVKPAEEKSILQMLQSWDSAKRTL